jgi:3-methylcrotonyl-CoA carboxylase alpha subunit
MKIASGGAERDVRVEESRALLDGEELAVSVLAEAPGGLVVEVGGRPHRVVTARKGDRAFVWCDGAVFEFSRAAAPARTAQARDDLVAPMTGRIRKLLISAGDPVEMGQPLVVLEAMKMEHTIRAPRAGTVRALALREGDLVDAGTPLAEIG